MKIGLVLDPGFQLIALGAVAAFDVANKRAGERLYDLDILSEDGGMLTGSSRHQHSEQTARRGGLRHPDRRLRHGDPDPFPGLIRLVRAAAQSTRRVRPRSASAPSSSAIADCSRAARDDHWRYASILQERVSELPGRSRQDLHRGWHLDLGGLDRGHRPRDRHDRARPRQRSRPRGREEHGALSPPLRRPSQHSALLEIDAREDRVQRAMNYARPTWRSPLKHRGNGRCRALSPRQFTRLFRMETGTTPAKAVEMLRVEAAKLMLEQSACRTSRSRARSVFRQPGADAARLHPRHGEVPRAIRSDAGRSPRCEAAAMAAAFPAGVRRAGCRRDRSTRRGASG